MGGQSKSGPQKQRDKDRDAAVGLTMTREEYVRYSGYCIAIRMQFEVI